MNYELTFFGAATVTAYKIPRYRRNHPTLESARATAREVYAKLDAKGLPSAAHPAVIYGSDGKEYSDGGLSEFIDEHVVFVHVRD